MRAGALTLPILLAACSVAAPVRAHDFWVEPSSFELPAPGAIVGLQLLVGDDFDGEALPRDPRHLEAFFVLGPEGRSELPGRAGASPAGRWRASSEGTHALAYRSRRTRVELPAESFERYLAEKGLDEVLLARALGENDQEPGREVYSRCAKTLLRVGAADPGGHARRAGLPLEIVPEQDPWGLAEGEALDLLVLWHGRGAEGLLVQARRHDAPEQVREAVTDEDGRVSLSLPAPGRWLIAAVHAAPAPPDLPARLSADWESTWATLVFELSPPPGSAVATTAAPTTEKP